MWQHGCGSSFASSRSCGATAATFVVAFVTLAAFAFVYSATACGHPDPAGGSCFQSGGAATLPALLVASFVFVLLFFVAQEPAGVHSFCDTDVLNMFYVIDGLCTLASIYWCVEDVFIIYRSCGSCICLVASCSSSCASVGILSPLEDDSSFLDGVLACAVVARSWCLHYLLWVQHLQSFGFA